MTRTLPSSFFWCIPDKLDKDLKAGSAVSDYFSLMPLYELATELSSAFPYNGQQLKRFPFPLLKDMN
jgi:hypothetical protein